MCVCVCVFVCFGAGGKVCVVTGVTWRALESIGVCVCMVLCLYVAKQAVLIYKWVPPLGSAMGTHLST